MSPGCDYDGVHNESVPIQLTSDSVVTCVLEIANQPPFIIWGDPEDESVYPSGSPVYFGGNESWDLDDDDLSYTWTSSIDGVLAMTGGSGSCSGTAVDNGSSFMANNWVEVVNASQMDCI